MTRADVLLHCPWLTDKIASEKLKAYTPVTEEEREAIRGIVNSGMYKPALQAKDWVGRAVAYALQPDVDEEAERNGLA